LNDYITDRGSSSSAAAAGGGGGSSSDQLTVAADIMSPEEVYRNVRAIEAAHERKTDGLPENDATHGSASSSSSSSSAALPPASSSSTITSSRGGGSGSGASSSSSSSSTNQTNRRGDASTSSTINSIPISRNDILRIANDHAFAKSVQEEVGY
jgi:hypothetical protein